MMMVVMMMIMMKMIQLTDPAGLLSIENKRVPPKIPPSPLLPRCVRQTGRDENQGDQDEAPWYSWTGVADNRAIEKTTNGGAERCQYLGGNFETI